MGRLIAPDIGSLNAPDTGNLSVHDTGSLSVPYRGSLVPDTGPLSVPDSGRPDAGPADAYCGSGDGAEWMRVDVQAVHGISKGGSQASFLRHAKH